MKLKCKACNKRKPIKYEQVGQGKYCQTCLSKEHKIYLREGGI